MGKYKIFVDGSSGTTGLRIADRLAERPEFTILPISEADRKDVHARAAVINESDLSFLCLPDDAAREVVPLLRPDVRVLDTSTAHRTAPGWTYGLPELHGTREALRTATRVAVPGCHATGFIAPVAPLVELGLVPKTALLHCTSLTGYSGGGKKMIAQYETERTDPALDAPRPYGLALMCRNLLQPYSPAPRPDYPADFRAGGGRLLRRYGDDDPAGSARSGPDSPAGGRCPGRVLRRAKDDLGPSAERGYRRRLPGCQ